MADELSDNDIFDSIVSGNPVPEQQSEPAQPAPQSRDEGGRFAAPAAQPAAVEPPVEPQTHGTEPQPSGGVPVGAVQDERQKRQAAQQRADELEKQLAVLQGQVTLLTQQRQPAPQPQQEDSSRSRSSRTRMNT
jgi:hypothetical protein